MKDSRSMKKHESLGEKRNIDKMNIKHGKKTTNSKRQTTIKKNKQNNTSKIEKTQKTNKRGGPYGTVNVDGA